jgi:hypothetical protein
VADPADLKPAEQAVQVGGIGPEAMPAGSQLDLTEPAEKEEQVADTHLLVLEV